MCQKIDNVRKKSRVLVFCALLFVASSSKHQLKSTTNEEIDDNLTIRYEFDENFMTNYNDETETLRYDLYEKSINNTHNDELLTSSASNDRKDDDSVQYELGTLSIKNHENDSHVLIELRTSPAKVNSKKNSTSQEIYRDLMKIEGKNDSLSYEFYETHNEDDYIYNIVPYEMCDNITCIPLCCLLGKLLIDDKCIPEKRLTPFFPNVYEHMNDSLQNESKRMDTLFHLVIQNPCRKSQHSLFDFNTGHSKYKYMIFTNGSLYLPYNIFVESTSYCLAIMHQNKSDVIICLENYQNYQKKKQSMKSINYKFIINRSLRIVSTLLLLGTFLVYAILPELRNTHGFMLRRYSALTSAANILNIIGNLIRNRNLAHFICVTIAFLKYYCFMASYFWLTVMSFDMWWTFKKLQSLQRNVRQQEKKKLAIYSIYAWGFPFILTIVCGIMNFVPGVPENLRPNFHCWFLDHMMLMLYYYMPKSICIISSICLSISTALKIQRYEKDAACYLRDSESRCYNKNKKWFNLYLKLFIMTFILMGIRWFTKTGQLLYKAIHLDKSYKDIRKYITYSMDIVLNLGIFIIFVCKKTIKRLLLKRFGCQKCHLFPKNRHKVDATSSSTCTTTSGGIPMQENISSYRQTNFDAIHSSDVTEL